MPGRRWLHWASLFLPLLAYNLALKIERLAAGDALEQKMLVPLILSDLLFNLGFALIGLGVIASSRRRRPPLIALHVLVLLYAIVTTSAHRYFEGTGHPLDYGVTELAFKELGAVKGAILAEIPWLDYLLVASYILFGPFLLTALATGLGFGRADPRGEAVSLHRGLAAGMLGAFLWILAFTVPSPTLGLARSRDPLVHLLASRVEGREAPVDPSPSTAPTLSFDARLRETRSTHPNLVIILLESIGLRATSLHDPALETTPFLLELAEKSLLAERAYTTLPHTSKALISVLCGIDPRPVRVLTERLPGLIPAKCLPELLNEHGFRTAFFQAATEHFEKRRALVDNIGFEEFYPGEAFRRDGFERANYFGFEDRIMLEPSRGWLEQHGGRPFFVTYLTNTSHHDYQAPGHYGHRSFVENDALNRYLNSVFYSDSFLRDLITQYQELGLYEKTIFVIAGDHGEAFGEHGLYVHDDVMYEEVLRIPLLVHDPRGRHRGLRIEKTASLLDVVPTVVDWLGFSIEKGSLPGHSLLRLPDRRTLFFACFNVRRCLARLEGERKYIYYYDHRPDEIFDLASDPMEQENLTAVREEERLGARRATLAWQSAVDAYYKTHHQKRIDVYRFESKPPIANERKALYGDHLSYLGYDLSTTKIRRGEPFEITYYFEVLERPPASWRLRVETEGSDGTDRLDLSHPPVKGLYRMRYWRAGEIVADTQTVRVPESWRSRDVLIYMSFLSAGKTVPVTSEDADGNGRALAVRIALLD